MDKKGSWFIWVSIALLVILVLLLFFYFALFHKNYDSKYQDKQDSGSLVNPAASLSVEEAVAGFNESFVYYMLYSIKAYNLHNPPLSSNTPKMEIAVSNDIYNAEIVDGEIYVAKGEIDSPDVRMTTTKEEAVKMLKDRNYVAVSFSNGNSGIDALASKSTLFAKGYLNLYNDLTGKSVTGNVIRIYSG